MNQNKILDQLNELRVCQLEGSSYTKIVDQAIDLILNLQLELRIAKQSEKEAWRYLPELEEDRTQKTILANKLQTQLDEFLGKRETELFSPIVPWYGFSGQHNDPMKAGLIEDDDLVRVVYTDKTTKLRYAKNVYWDRNVPEDCPYVISFQKDTISVVFDL